MVVSVFSDVHNYDAQQHRAGGAY